MKNPTEVDVYTNCLMETFHSDGPSDLWPAEVRIGPGDQIAVTYQDDPTVSIYEGLDDGVEHYTLTFPAKKGKATLHRFPNSFILEGYWEESGQRGMWHITLRR